MIAPAFAVGLMVTAWLGYGYVTNGMHDSDSDFVQDFLMIWMFLAGPALATSLLTACVLWSKRRKMRANAEC